MRSPIVAVLTCILVLAPSLCRAEAPGEDDTGDFIRILIHGDMFHGTDDYFGEYRDLKLLEGIGDEAGTIGGTGTGGCPT